MSLRFWLCLSAVWLMAWLAVPAIAPIQVARWSPPDNPGLTGVFSPNLRLDEAQQTQVGPGPELVACDADGNRFTGIEDGSILRISPDNSVHLIANTGGRPLGIRSNPEGGLWIADAIRGVLAVSPEGHVTVLADSFAGERMKFVDDLDVSSEGVIWFSDASQRYGFDETMFDFYEGSRTGRLLRLDTRTGELSVAMSGLFFANGVSLGPDEAYVLVNETGMGRTHRLWLKGERAGERDIFVDQLPGAPDNIRFDGDGLFWIAMPSLRDSLDSLADLPRLRAFVSMLPDHWMEAAANVTSLVIAVNLDGEVVHNLQGSGERMAYITGVNPCGDYLELGSLQGQDVGRLRRP